MSSFNCSIHFYTLKQIGYEESNVAVTSYHERTHFETNNTYTFYAEEFHLQQGRKFTLHNKLATLPTKISKFKDQIKELDEVFTNSKQTLSNDLINENINHFLACYNSNIAKIIWLGPNRLLLVMRDSILIWILFDTISGDLIKLKIDKSLTSNIQLFNSHTSSTSSAKHAYLSGKLISDAILVMQSESTSLVLTYSDASKVDIIKLNKSSLNYFKDYKIQQLKKLSEFEPHLKTYEFAVPNQYLIEKKLVTLNETNETFTVWWENSSQLMSLKQENESKSISLLDRDDLRNNIQILSLNLAYDNLLEYLFKSDGNLVSVSYLNKTSLIAIEQVEDKNKMYSLNIYRYNLPNELNLQVKNSLKIKLISFELTSKIISSEQIRPSRNNILMLSGDQTVIIYEINRNLYRLHKLTPNEDYAYNGIEWFIDDLIFGVYNINGDLTLYDIGFNLLNINYMNRETISFKSISHYLNQNLFTRLSTTNKKFDLNKNCFQRINSSRMIFTESLWSCFYFSNGPLGLLRISLTDNFSCVSLVNYFLKNSFLNQHSIKHLENAVNLIVELDWDVNAKLVLSCLNKIINYILTKEEFSSKIEQLGKKALCCFFKPKKQLNEKTIYENKPHVCKLARKFFYKLIKHKCFHSAYLLSVDIGSKDLFNDLYYCALDANENQIAEICRKTYHEMIKNKEPHEMSIIHLEVDEQISEEIDANDSVYNYYNENVYDLNDSRVNLNRNMSQIYSLSEIEQFAQSLNSKIKIN